MDLSSLLGSSGGGGGASGGSPSSSANASNTFGAGDHSTLYAVLAVALVAVLGIVLAFRK